MEVQGFEMLCVHTVIEDRAQLLKVGMQQVEDLYLPCGEAVHVEEVHRLPRRNQPVVLLLLLALEGLGQRCEVEAGRHRHTCVVDDRLLVAQHAPAI